MIPPPFGGLERRKRRLGLLATYTWGSRSLEAELEQACQRSRGAEPSRPTREHTWRSGVARQCPESEWLYDHPFAAARVRNPSAHSASVPVKGGSGGCS
jgi:hypothetical protein